MIVNMDAAAEISQGRQKRGCFYILGALSGSVSNAIKHAQKK